MNFMMVIFVDGVGCRWVGREGGRIGERVED